MNYFNSLRYDPERPVQVTYAVILLYISLAITVAAYLILTVTYYAANPDYFSAGTVVGAFTVNVIGYLLMFLVAYKIGEGRNWARWLLLIGFIMSLLGAFCSVIDPAGSPIASMVDFGNLLATAVAAALLFQRPCSVWFKAGGKTAGNNNVELEVS